MMNDRIAITEDSFMEGAMSSFPASDPPSYMAGVAISGGPSTTTQTRKPCGAMSRRSTAGGANHEKPACK